MPNRLAQSTSPYLRQHQDNPVDWHEWGVEAFEEAVARDVPILLSVGYSACHWCHVMAHESFEDPVTAALMNDLFVNVKVDREERPDVDAVYMEAVQAMSGHGGWPMTVWLTPEGLPFYAGTYFPKEPRGGMASFSTVMQAISEAWTDRRDDVAEQANRLTEAMNRAIPSGSSLPGPEVLRAAYETLLDSHDPVNGGFGGAPKFPQQPALEFLLRLTAQPWAEDASRILTETLVKMARGGIYDQVGGGFARYSVDASWLVPHFEKMLYDNAQLARLYVWAWRELGVDEFRTIAEETLAYLRTDMRHPDGGFYSAEDADSEGEEGRFYVWTLNEFTAAVDEYDLEVALAHFGVTSTGNFEGSNILHVARTSTEIATSTGAEPDRVRA
ncbi:MAG: thioredoxin domain-containing protein, partial [Acidimicrobiia bacterium]|nr:thioredoxin domain-containing protein [Acidimicrobiia bacterium]